MKRVMLGLLGVAVACCAWADSAEKILEDAGVKAGIVVVVGQCDAGLLAARGANEACVVQGLDTDAARVANARKQI